MLFESVLRDFIRLLPTSRLKKEKENVRALLLQRRRILTKEQVSECSAEVVAAIARERSFIEAKAVMLYYPVRNEIDLRELLTLAPNKTYLLPVTHRHSIEMRQYAANDKLHRGKYGIPEPDGNSYNGKVNLILVPGVGFDKNNHRIGRGGGYYDRFLKRFRYTMKIGVGYKFQLVDKLPFTTKDVKVDKVIVATKA